jgi:hypothetical protein
VTVTRSNAGDVLEGGDARRLEELVVRFVPPEGARHPATKSDVAAADWVARHWTSVEVGPFAAGSAAHKRAICAMFQETFNPYRPSVIAWPTLGPDELRRLQSLPIWDIAVQTEGRARLSFAAFADPLDDADMRSTIMLNAWEEHRHKEVLSHMVRAYGIELAKEPAYLPPRDREFAFLVTGYSESIDSFFAFGLFELARRSGFFPPELVETFEPVIQEECRHILLFANWLAWHRANLSWWRRIRFELRVAAVWVYIARLRVGLARSVGTNTKASQQANNFTVNGAQAVASVEIGFLDLMQVCLQENDRRLAGYDPRLSRPTRVPALARFALAVGKLWPGKRRSLERGPPSLHS